MFLSAPFISQIPEIKNVEKFPFKLEGTLKNTGKIYIQGGDGGGAPVVTGKGRQGWKYRMLNWKEEWF